MFYVISLDDCTWCDRAEQLLLLSDHDFLIENVSPFTKRLMLKAGLRTVPQIWKDDEYIGGYQELVDHFEQQKENQ